LRGNRSAFNDGLGEIGAPGIAASAAVDAGQHFGDGFNPRIRLDSKRLGGCADDQRKERAEASSEKYSNKNNGHRDSPKFEARNTNSETTELASWAIVLSIAMKQREMANSNTFKFK
jgi:chromatin remodeling complex protein RSC6